MVLIEWREEFKVGVPEVDQEHQELIELINELYQGLQSGQSGLTVVDFLGEIYTKISAHFALEEKLMREQDYDEFQDHKTDHEKLLDDIRDIMDDYEDGVATDYEKLSLRLSHWFTEHFKTKDARLHQHLHP